MKVDNVFLVVCGTLVLVFIINAGILVALLRSEATTQIKVIGKVIDAVRDPWKKSNEEMKELHQRISRLEKQPNEETENDH